MKSRTWSACTRGGTATENVGQRGWRALGKGRVVHLKPHVLAVVLGTTIGVSLSTLHANTDIRFLPDDIFTKRAVQRQIEQLPEGPRTVLSSLLERLSLRPLSAFVPSFMRDSEIVATRDQVEDLMEVAQLAIDSPRVSEFSQNHARDLVASLALGNDLDRVAMRTFATDDTRPDLLTAIDKGDQRYAARDPDAALKLFSTLDITSAELNAASIEAIANNLTLLMRVGEAAVPAINRFLARGADLQFAQWLDEKSRPDYDSLRLNLIHVLGTIAGPAAIDVLKAELDVTTNAAEIAALATYLEDRAPGVYRDQTLRAVRETLAMTSSGELDPQNMTPAFNVLARYGDGDVVAELQRNTAMWAHLATVALAELPDGRGVGEIVRTSLNVSKDNPATGLFMDKRRLALHMLAQIAVTQGQARDALLNHTRSGSIPERLWPELAEVLSGNRQLQMEKPDASGHTKFSRHQVGQDILYAVNFADTLSQSEIEQRLKLIAELRASTPSHQARAALDNAAAQLRRAGA